MASLPDICRQPDVEKSLVESALFAIRNDENNPHGALDDRDQYGESALRWAATNGRDDIVSLLLEWNVDVNILNDMKESALHAACWNNKQQCCSLLLNANATIDLVDKDGCTPLHKACWRGNKNIVSQLIGNGAAIEAEDINSATPLHYAAVQGHEATIELLLSVGADSLRRDKKGVSAIQRATASGRLEVVKMLLNKGSNVEDTDANGLTLLHRVAVKGHYNIVEELLKRGANPLARDAKGATPIHKAAQTGSVEVLKLLLRNGATLECEDNNGGSPLHKAALSGEVAALAWLLDENGGDIEQRDKNMCTPLFYACWSNESNCIRYLIGQGANINAKNSLGNTPILDSCIRGHLTSVELLVLNKANILAPNTAGSTAFVEAIKNQRRDVVRFILQKYSMKSLGGPEAWEAALKLANSLKNEPIFKLIMRANKSEITRENIYENLKIVQVEYENLRENLGQAEYLCALLDRHGFYGKWNNVIEVFEECDPLLRKLMEGVDPESLAEDALAPASDYARAERKLHELCMTFDNELTLGSSADIVEESAPGKVEGDADIVAPSAEEILEKKKMQVKRFQKKQDLHKEVEVALESMVKKMLPLHPLEGEALPLNTATQNFNEWRMKISVEVVDYMRRIDSLSRQLHDTLAYGKQLIEDQKVVGKELTTQLVHASIQDKKDQASTAIKVQECRAYQKQLKVLLERAQEREEILLQQELEERRRREAEERERQLALDENARKQKQKEDMEIEEAGRPESRVEFPDTISVGSRAVPEESPVFNQ